VITDSTIAASSDRSGSNTFFRRVLSARCMVQTYEIMLRSGDFMRIDIQRLDEQIRKLQEVRSIAADPEFATILSDFVETEEAVGLPVFNPDLETALKPNVVTGFGVRLKR
jgi:hypothetical protein